MAIREEESEALADRILAARSARVQIHPITDSDPTFDMADAYDVSARIAHRRIAAGEKPVGWKIGFTNSAIWEQQGLTAPIWAPMYDTTVTESGVGRAEFSASRLPEPRIEPEIGLRLGSVPHPDMDESELMECVEAVTHGFEIVQSIYPGWKLKPPDAVAGFGMHGGYCHGPLVPVPPAERQRWLTMLVEFTVVIFRDGVEMDRGAGRNVLGGPLSALRHFVGDIGRYPAHALCAGDLITTGTLTQALQASTGGRWSTKLEGIPLPAMNLALF